MCLEHPYMPLHRLIRNLGYIPCSFSAQLPEDFHCKNKFLYLVREIIFV